MSCESSTWSVLTAYCSSSATLHYIGLCFLSSHAPYATNFKIGKVMDKRQCTWLTVNTSIKPNITRVKCFSAGGLDRSFQLQAAPQCIQLKAEEGARHFE